MEDYLTKLNPQQKEAATTIDGYMLLSAGAGSGKTATLIARVAYMLDHGIPGSQILLLTFTNKAAKEMKQRINKMVNGATEDITACTFHSFCSNFLRKYIDNLGYSANFSIKDAVDAADIMGLMKEEFFEEEKKAGRTYPLKDFPTPKEILNIHSRAVNSETDVDDIIFATKYSYFSNEIKKIIDKYEDYMFEKNLLDYDSLLRVTNELFEFFEPIRKEISAKYKYVMVDEYQDTNVLQEKFLEYVTKDNGNLCVVGDAQQSIYAFRSANVDNIISFADRHPTCKKIELFQNYRSSQEILDLPNEFMKFCNEGEFIRLQGQFSDKRPELVITNNGYEEGDFVYNEVKRYHNHGVPYKKIAVMSRNGHQTRFVEAMFTKNRIPFKKFGGVKFLEKPTVKDVLAFVSIMENEKDAISLFRILQLYPGIGTTRAKAITESIMESGLSDVPKKYLLTKYVDSIQEFCDIIAKLRPLNLHDKIRTIIEDYYPDLQERVINAKKTSESKKWDERNTLDKNLLEASMLLSLAEPYKSAREFLDDIVLEASEEDDSQSDYVNVTTIHSAKGLEYDVVFILDAVDSTFVKSDYSEEELRVFYVACTRAKKRLYIMVPEFAETNGHDLRPNRNKIVKFLNKESVLRKMDTNSPKWKVNSVR